MLENADMACSHLQLPPEVHHQTGLCLCLHLFHQKIQHDHLHDHHQEVLYQPGLFHRVLRSSFWMVGWVQIWALAMLQATLLSLVD